jgi:hypothetical protein
MGNALDFLNKFPSPPRFGALVPSDGRASRQNLPTSEFKRAIFAFPERLDAFDDSTRPTG